jgi:signal transduction histidine kinase
MSSDDTQAALSQLFSSDDTEMLNQLDADLGTVIRLAQEQEAIATNVMESAQGFEKFLIIVSITAAGLLAGFLAWRATSAIATPIEDITQVARRVTYDADYTARATIFYDDEVGVLARSLNELIEQVSERTRSLEAAAKTAVAQRQELENTLQVLKKAQLQLVQAEKMSSLGQLVAGITHELNNPIGFIHGNLTYVQEYADTLFNVVDRLQVECSEISSDLAAYLKEADVDFIRQDFPNVLRSISNGTERINSLVLSLKVFSRLQESQLKRANLNEGLESTLLLLGHRLKSQAKRLEVNVVRRYSDLPEIECFSRQMNQVFVNIVDNALDAIDERWEKDACSWKPTLIITTELEKDHVRIRIYNNGLPIPNSVQTKIFDPFFTTKPIGKGVGLGMSISYEIVCEKHHGEIEFVSPVTGDIGTEFFLKIPIPEPTPASKDIARSYLSA